MTTTPESSSFDTPSGRTSDLEVGLTAFKEAEYATAIILLEPALAESPTHPLIARAQMGLAVSYEKMGETQRAAAVCQSLRAGGNSQVQDWATRTLTSLIKRHPELASFLAVVEPTAPDSIPATAAAAPVAGATTGFQPLVEAIASPQSEPLQPPAAAIAPLPDATPPPQPPPPRSPVSQPIATQRPAPVPELPSLYQPHWRQAGRAQQWKPLGSVNLLKLMGIQGITAIAIFLAVQQVFYWITVSYGNAIIKTLPRMGFRIVQPGAPTWTEGFTLISLLLLLVGSRWILDGLLTGLYGLKPLSLQTLSAYSPEAATSLPRFCRKANISVPVLGLLPTTAPIMMSYGGLPRVSRIVISQGLLDQLADDEIAALYANEVGHLSHWTVPLMAGIVTLLQLPYTLYWLTAEWGNSKSSPITKFSATLIALISYGFFWLWRWVPLWLARQRSYYSDRVAADLTGNPNGYTRALVKLAISTASDITQHQQTSYLLEGFELLSPLGYRNAAALGSLYPHAPVESLLTWERTHPLRHWLAIKHTHPPTGDRLNLLMLYARHWRLDTELNWAEMANRRQRQSALSTADWRSLLLQGSPYWGFGVGVAIALWLKIIGGIGVRARWDWVSWLASDRTVLIGLPLVGLCIGTLLRLNPFFPDLQAQGRQTGYADQLLPLLTQGTGTPLNSQSLRLEGTLIGRRGIANGWHQDLWLNTAKGLIRLHYTARLGILGSLLPGNTPTKLVNTAIVTTGWFRRGVTPWVDVETLQTATGRIERSYHPLWSFVIATIAAVWGILVLFNFKF